MVFGFGWPTSWSSNTTEPNSTENASRARWSKKLKAAKISLQTAQKEYEEAQTKLNKIEELKTVGSLITGNAGQSEQLELQHTNQLLEGADKLEAISIYLQIVSNLELLLTLDESRPGQHQMIDTTVKTLEQVEREAKQLAEREQHKAQAQPTKDAKREAREAKREARR